MSQTQYSNDLVMTCVFSHMEQVSVEDGKLKVLGRNGYPPVVEGSMESDFKIEVDHETGMFRTLIDGPLKTDSHPLKYRFDSTSQGVDVDDSDEGD